MDGMDPHSMPVGSGPAQSQAGIVRIHCGAKSGTTRTLCTIVKCSGWRLAAILGMKQ